MQVKIFSTCIELNQNGRIYHAWLLKPCIWIKFKTCTGNLDLHKLKMTFIDIFGGDISIYLSNYPTIYYVYPTSIFENRHVLLSLCETNFQVYATGEIFEKKIN